MTASGLGRRILAVMNRGMTLIEIALVLLIAGLVAIFAAAPLLGLRDRLAVDQAARDIASLHARARLLAMVESRPIRLDIGADSSLMRAIADGDTITRWRGAGLSAEPATVSGPSRPLWFSPAGVTYGVSNATWVVTRGAVERRVIVSRWGRVRIE
jgi:prepilin-type N-terminal cleavage/methylation domain-containing protein